MTLRKINIGLTLAAILIIIGTTCMLQQTAHAAGALTAGDPIGFQTQSRIDDLNAAVVAAQERVDAAEGELAAAQDEQSAAQEAIDGEVADPGTNAGHKEWTAYGLFQSIRDSAQTGSAAYWDAQCAMDILDGGINTTGHSYASKQGPAPDGYNAANWANIADNIAWAERGDAVALGNVLTSLEFLNEFNSIRAEENAAEGTSLSTTIGTNCRQMAISIVQCDTSKVRSVSHTQAYEGLENLSWSSALAVPFSRSKYTDPYVGWYDEEKVNYKENNGGVTGHYTTIVDLNSGYFCEIAGFAVCSFEASYGECRELSTFGDFFQYDTNPTPEMQYSIAEFQQIANAYYAEQVEAGMFGTTDEVRAAHAAALESATTRVANAQAELTAAQAELAAAQSALDAFTDLSTSDAIVVSGVADVQYNGSEQKPVPVVTVMVASEESVTLEKGVDYTVNYPSQDYTNAGEVSVEIVGTGQAGSGTWWGTRAVTFSITPKRLDATGVVIALSESSFTYNGQVQKPAIESIGGETLVEGTDYEVSWPAAEPTNVGEYTVTITGKGNYAGSAQATFAIEPATVAIPSAVEGLVYNGDVQTGVAAGPGYSVAGGSATNAGSYTATASLTDSANYAWSDGTTASKAIQWAIAPKLAVVTSCDATKAYGEQDPAFEATVEGVLDGDSLSYSFEREPGEGVGSYAIAPTGNADQGNYSVTYRAEGALTITKAASAISLANEVKPYNGKAQAYAGAVAISGSGGAVLFAYFSDETCENPVDTSDVKNAATYYVRATLAGDANYEGATSNVAMLTIQPKPVNVTVAGKNEALTYTGAVQTISGYSIESDDPDYDVTKVMGPEQEDVCAFGTDVGTYEVPIESSAFTNSDANYEVTFVIASSMVLTIDPASIEGAALVLDTSGAPYVYNGDPQKPAVLAVGEMELVEDTDFDARYSGPDENCANAGSYTVVVVGKGNYTGTSASAGYTIEKAGSSVSISDAIATYAGEAIGYNGEMTRSGSGGAVSFAYYRDETCENSVEASDVKDTGTYFVKAMLAADENHNGAISDVAMLTINPAQVTVAADSKSKAFGESDPDLTATVTGLFGDDTVAYSVSRVEGEKVGEYAITASGDASQGNYDVSFEPATFTIVKAASRISIAAQSKTYTGKVLAYSGKMEKSGSAGEVTYAYYSDSKCTKAATPKAAGTYYVKATVAADADYAAATSAAAKFTVIKAKNPMVFKAQTKTVKYSKVKAAKQVVAITKASKAQGTVTYAKVKANKKAGNFTVNKTTGKITVKKGTPKGTYKVTVKATAKGNANYKSGYLNRVITIKVS